MTTGEQTASAASDTRRPGPDDEADATPSGPPPRAGNGASKPRRAPVDQRAGRPGFFTRLWDRIENKFARLSSRSNFWHRVCSWLWLPFAFRSGIRIHKTGQDSFWAVLPFTRFNRNWYHAMAGAALLGNAEIAGGMFVFGKTGADWTVVCKELHYKFLRPCVGPACYRIETKENIEELIEAGDEFNTSLDIDVVQMVTKKNDRERRVGKVEATFHVTPKEMVRERRDRRQRVARERAENK